MADAADSLETDPDAYRMSLGDHLEELRRRIIRALIGFAVAVAVCAYWGSDIVSFFCQPLRQVLAKHDLNPQLIYTQVGESLSLYFYVVGVSAAVIASPWMLYQLWQFVAAGLYPKERRVVWKLAPLSMALLIGGVVFCYLVVLPTSLDFFIEFSDTFPVGAVVSNASSAAPPPTGAPQLPMAVPVMEHDPAVPPAYTMWFNTAERRLKLALPSAGGAVTAMAVQLVPTALLVPQIRVSDYVDMVLLWLLIFAIAFQMPLLQLAAVRTGLISVETFKTGRRFAYLGITVAAALIMPDVFSGTIALMVPLVILYELGIFLGSMGPKGE